MFGAKNIADLKKPVEEGTKALVQINDNFGRIQRNFEEVVNRLGKLEAMNIEMSLLRAEIKSLSEKLDGAK